MAPGALAIVVWTIVGGTTVTGDPAVVGIAHRPVACGDAPVVTCTGVLVGPRAVLTAAHCIEGTSARGGLEVIVGSDAAAPSAVIVVQSTQAFAQYVPSTGDGDLALLLLAEDAPVAAIARPTGSVADLASGAALRAVGFGVTGWTVNDPGIKREGTLALGTVGAARFDAAPSPAMTCTADSGGPVFATINTSEQLVGITSRGDSACGANAVSARVDVAQSSFIDPFITTSASSPAGWPASIPFTRSSCSVDEDCPALMTCNERHQCGFSWLGFGSFGGGCTSDAGCGTGRCVRAWPAGADACHCFASDNPPPGDDSVTSSPPGGCCDSSGGGSATSALLLLALARAAKRKLFHARDQRRA